MRESIEVHADLVLRTLGTEFFIGHGGICGTSDGIDPREIATFLHKLAWAVEEEYSDKNDFTKPGPRPMSLADAMNKIKVEYGEAIELLGKL